jgi:hypothetical protein
MAVRRSQSQVMATSLAAAREKAGSGRQRAGLAEGRKLTERGNRQTEVRRKVQGEGGQQNVMMD